MHTPWSRWIISSLIPFALIACDRGTTGDVSVSEEPEAMTAGQSRQSLQPVASSAELDVSRVDPERRAAIERLLGGFEHQPTGAELLAIEPDEDTLRATLLVIYEDDSAKRGARQRALTSMQYVPGEATNLFYASKLRDGATEKAERRVLVRAYANAAGSAAEPVLIEQLSHDDPATRGLVADELGAMNSDASRAALEARAKVETMAFVRKKIGAALGRDIGEQPGQISPPKGGVQ